MDGKPIRMWLAGGVTYSVSVVIAALNESATIAQLVEGIKSLNIVDTIILIDDASTDGMSQIAKKHGCNVLMNDIRIGQTRSIRRGLEAAHTDIMITMDADMDHLPSDIPRLLTTFHEQGADVVVGKRDNLPRLAERIMSKVVHRTTGITDIVSGFRVISKNTLAQIQYDDDNTWGSLFLIRCAKKGLKLAEVPIQTPTRRKVTRTGGKFESNVRIYLALGKDILCMADLI